MERPILVASAIIQKNNKILIAQRKTESLLEANKWEFPGGKVEYCENPEDTIIREIKEELDINIKIEKFLTVSSHVYVKENKDYHCIVLFYIAKYKNGKIKLNAHQNYAWVKKEEINKYPFVEGNKKIIDLL